MIIKKRDNIEEWTAKTMLQYVVQALREKGNNYTPTYPKDIMLAGLIFKNCKIAGKSNAFIRNRINEKLNGCCIKHVKSLRFLMLFFQDIKFHQQKNNCLKTSAVTVPNRAITALRKIKKDIPS